MGTFSTTDPDDTNGTGIYTYQLIIDQNKTAPPLNLDTNGTLTTTSIFNFESEGNYSIRVKTSDSNGASFEKDFVIYVIDEFPPYVETGNANLGSDGRYTLYGTVVDEGGISGILERGFVISSKPITNLLDSGITKLVSTINDNNFSSSFTPTLAGKQHYYRAYAINAESDLERRKLLPLPLFPVRVIGRMPSPLRVLRTGGKVHGLLPTMHPIQINGLCIPNWAGSIQAQVWIPVSGYGKMD